MIKVLASEDYQVVHKAFCQNCLKNPSLKGRREDFKAYSLEVHHKVFPSLLFTPIYGSKVEKKKTNSSSKVDYTPRFISKISIKVSDHWPLQYRYRYNGEVKMINFHFQEKIVTFTFFPQMDFWSFHELGAR